MASELYVETLKGLTSGDNANKVIIPSGQTLYAPGHVIQVVSSKDTTMYSVSVSGGSSSTSSYAPTATLGTITPTSASSSIVCNWTCPQIDHGGAQSGLYLNVWRSINGGSYTKLDLGGTAAGNRHSAYYSNIDQTGDSNRIIGGGFSGSFEDSPNTTDSVQYKLYVGMGDNTSLTIYVNRTSGDADQVYTGRCATHSVLMEIAG